MTSLRRMDQIDIGKEKDVAKLCWCPSASFSFPADSAIAGIFKNYAAPGELLADAVGLGEIAALPGSLALRHQRFNFRVGRPGGGVGQAECVEFFRVIIMQHGKNQVEGFEHSERRSHVALAEFAAIDRRIYIADQIEDCRERLRGI